MSVNSSLLGYFWQASIVVKIVLFLLLAASILSWTYIIGRWKYLKATERAITTFEQQVWKSTNLAELYQSLKEGFMFHSGLDYVFHAGFQAFVRAQKTRPNDVPFIMENVERSMRVAQAEEQEKLEENLPVLATIGSISPYVGLFGTVWGIMMAFHDLSGAEQVTIAMVAPGIAEALIATAMGLFAAIPAVIAYNKYSSEIDRLLNRIENFQERFTLLLTQAIYAEERERVE